MDPNTYEMHDPRYHELAYNISALDLLTTSGIFTQQLDLPNYSTYVPNPAQVKTDVSYGMFCRPTITWKLSCEANGNTRQALIN